MFSRLLWDAEKSQGIFNPLYKPQNPGAYNLAEFNENKEYIQNGLKIYRLNIGNRMKEFIRTRDELLEEIIKLNKYIEMVVLARLTPVNMFNALILGKEVYFSNK